MPRWSPSTTPGPRTAPVHRHGVRGGPHPQGRDPGRGAAVPAPGGRDHRRRLLGPGRRPRPRPGPPGHQAGQHHAHCQRPGEADGPGDRQDDRLPRHSPRARRCSAPPSACRRAGPGQAVDYRSDLCSLGSACTRCSPGRCRPGGDPGGHRLPACARGPGAAPAAQPRHPGVAGSGVPEGDGQRPRTATRRRPSSGPTWSGAGPGGGSRPARPPPARPRRPWPRRCCRRWPATRAGRATRPRPWAAGR